MFHLLLGFMTVALAIDDGFAEGKVTFASDAWRYAFGVAGAFMTYRAARALVRAINRATIPLTPGVYRVARIHGLLLMVIGVGFIVVSRSEMLGERSIELTGWVDGLYLGGGILLAITGLFQTGPRPAPRRPPA